MTRRIFVVLNPASGSATAEAVRDALGRHSANLADAPECHETLPGEAIAGLVREAVGKGYDLVVAAGGDGTVSAVAGALVGTGTPLGIIPLGTANVLARELGIPVALEDACALVLGAHALRAIDAMRVGGAHYFTQVGVGIDALMIRDTGREAKRRFGRVAYLWTAARSLLGFPPRRFTVTTDGRTLRRHASQVVIANSGTLGQPPFRWGPDILLDDGRLDVCIVRARNLGDYVALAWHVLRGQHRRSANVLYLVAEHRVAVATKRPLPVQADGEIIGQTPVAVDVVHHAVQVVVPASGA